MASLSYIPHWRDSTFSAHSRRVLRDDGAGDRLPETRPLATRGRRWRASPDVALLALLAVGCLVSFVELVESSSQYFDLQTRVSAGSGFTCVVDETATLDCFGRNDFGQAGRAVDAPTFLRSHDELQGVTHVSAGGRHVCAVLQANSQSKSTARCFGDGTFGKLFSGRSATQPLGEAAVVAFNVADVVGVHCGDSHTCFHLSNGNAKCTGSGLFGQLGNGRREVANLNDLSAERLRLPAGLDVLRLCAGGFHTAVLATNNKVYAVGRNSEGQLGLSHLKDRGFDPSHVGEGMSSMALGGAPRVAALACTALGTCLLSVDGTVRCSSSEGLKKIPVEGRCVKVFGGSSAYHAGCLLDSGALALWGDGRHGQLGRGRDAWNASVAYVRFGEGEEVEDSALGDRHTVVRFKSGKVKAFGSGQYQALGYESREDRVEAGEQLPYLRRLYAAESTTAPSDHPSTSTPVASTPAPSLVRTETPSRSPVRVIVVPDFMTESPPTPSAPLVSEPPSPTASAAHSEGCDFTCVAAASMAIPLFGLICGVTYAWSTKREFPCKRCRVATHRAHMVVPWSRGFRNFLLAQQARQQQQQQQQQQEPQLTPPRFETPPVLTDADPNRV